jgi:hypothetical protein
MLAAVMNPIERSVTLDEVRQLEAFIALKKKLLKESTATEVRELLEVQINDLSRRRHELMEQLRPQSNTRVS